MKQKDSSDVKDSLWNHSDKKVIRWHCEAPLFLRVYVSVSPVTTTFTFMHLADAFIQSDLQCIPAAENSNLVSLEYIIQEITLQ